MSSRRYNTIQICIYELIITNHNFYLIQPQFFCYNIFKQKIAWKAHINNFLVSNNNSYNVNRTTMTGSQYVNYLRSIYFSRTHIVDKVVWCAKCFMLLCRGFFFTITIWVTYKIFRLFRFSLLFQSKIYIIFNNGEMEQQIQFSICWNSNFMKF